MVKPGPATAVIVALAGALPIIAAHAAYLLNLSSGSALAAEFICMPYLDGCVSVSRAARSGSGLTLFRWLMLPSAALLLTAWFFVRRFLGAAEVCSAQRSWVISALGMLGAVFLVLYVTALGNEDEWYQWQRRYGVILYFGGTALAQLLLVWILWPLRRALLGGLLRRPITLLTLLVGLQWALGIFSVSKRLLFENPALLDRIENVIEWWYALAMSLAFIAIAWLFRLRS